MQNPGTQGVEKLVDEPSNREDDTAVTAGSPCVDSLSAGSVQALIAKVALARPTHPAVVADGKTTTYGDLYERALRLAGRLKQADVTRDDIVAVHLPRGVDLIVAALAALLVDACYLAIDVEQPVSRTRYMIDDSGAKVVIGHSVLWEPFGNCAAVHVDLNDVRFESAPYISQVESEPDALAYLTYTSGSTGTPKGVLVPHRGLNNLVAWYGEHFQVTSADRMTQMTRPSFDAWVLEVWPCLAHGATLHIADAQTIASPERLVEWLHSTAATVCFVPTPLATEILRLTWPRHADGTVSLRAMLVGGDRLGRHPAHKLPFRLFNNYGPTECTVVATSGEVTDIGSSQPPSIGVPIRGVSAYVLGEDGLPVAPGEQGELHLGGVAVARGYLGGPGRRHGGFLPDPFDDDPQAQMYATGDLVRGSEDGHLHFLGRLDDQIKIRGVRIEPAEIEAALLRQEAVRSAAVVRHQPRGDDGEQLLAYVVLEDESNLRTIRARLADELPTSMLPNLVLEVPALPLTPHGKIDRRALAARELTATPSTDMDSHMPTTGAAGVLSRLWGEVLGLQAVDPSQNFFEIGGDSLRVMRLVSKARKEKITLLPEDVFQYPVLCDLLASLDLARPVPD